MNHSLYLLSVGLHILAAMTWIGGMLFLVIVLVPGLRKLEDRALAAALIRETGRRFRLVGWISLAVLVGTGLSNLYARGVSLSTVQAAQFWATPFGQVLAFKLACVLLILILSAVHDFSIGPKASAALTRQPVPPEAARLRAMATWMGRLNLVLALIVAACGIMLVRGRPW